ncbi:MAG: DUF1816 domain-containing protein [Prochloraceae cyanobacterium]|nr:DUF1816 domain-containing protein [Prochloraceae cyanobacterium]
MVSIDRKSQGFNSAKFNKREIKQWWVEVNTDVPRCTYYFGPFNTSQEAREHQAGYVEDLIEEGSGQITLNIKKCRPQALTIEVFY